MIKSKKIIEENERQWQEKARILEDRILRETIEAGAKPHYVFQKEKECEKRRNKKKKKACNHYFCRGNKKAVKENICLYKKFKWI